MTELELKYGLNPHQKPARLFMEEGELPVKVLCGRPGYINFLDALNGYQLVKELRAAAGLPAAASFKHVSPAGAAVGKALTQAEKEACFAEGVELSPLASAYARARGADRMSSFGDFISLSDPCDVSTARFIAREVSDGIIAPGYDPEALEILRGKRKGNYSVIEIDPAYRPAEKERKTVYGVCFEQGRNEAPLNAALLENIVTRNKEIPEEKKLDLIIALIALKYTQSNSVAVSENGQTIGVGAGQQSRIHCTRLACQKADLWHLRLHEKTRALKFREGLGRPEKDNAVDLYLSNEAEELLSGEGWKAAFSEKPRLLSPGEKKEWLKTFSGASLGSDAFFPFGDNIERARLSGVGYVAQPGGSIRDDNVIEACDRFGIAMAFTGLRLFHH